LLLAFSIVGLQQANLNHTLTYRKNADIPSILLALRRIHDETGQRVLLAHSDGFKSAVWYYAKHLLALNPKPSVANEPYFRAYDWLTVYEWRAVYPQLRLSSQPLLPGTTFLLLDRDDERWLTSQLGGKLTLLQNYPASDLRLYALTASERRGIFITMDGSEYVGEFKDGEPSGQGTLTSTNGMTYIGELKDSMLNGQGTETWPDGRTYVGEFQNGVAIGRGAFTWADGTKYVGEWKAGQPNGQGTKTWPDGRKYVGQFHDWKMDGTGLMNYPDGKVEDGAWKDDKLVGTSTSPP
jgi:hypothetical protein